MYNNNTNQITDINTLQFIHKLHNFIHIIGMQSNRAAITLSGSGSSSTRIRQQISGHDPVPAGLKKMNPVHPY